MHATTVLVLKNEDATVQIQLSLNISVLLDEINMLVVSCWGITVPENDLRRMVGIFSPERYSQAKLKRGFSSEFCRSSSRGCICVA